MVRPPAWLSKGLVIAAKAEAIAWIRAGWERAWALRRNSLRFAPHFLDRIEIRGVSRQEQGMGAELLDKPKSFSAFVR
jgi:hypothetical protein